MIGTLVNSPRAQRRFLWLSGAVLVAGIAAFVALVLFRGTGNAYPDKFSKQPAQLAKPEKKVPISANEIAIARKFIKTAVMRQNLDAAYNITHVDLKGRMTRKAWDTGNIPVVGYPALNADTAPFQVDFSYQDEALLEVDLDAKPGSGVRPELLFFLGLKKSHGKWLVSYWEPHWKPPIPATPN